MSPSPAGAAPDDEPREGFGAPSRSGAHVFAVRVPAATRQPVVVAECYGDGGGHGGVPEEEVRVRLERSAWGGVRDAARRDFNARLKAAGLAVGRWSTGQVKLERILGQELCVLCWAAEGIDPDRLPVLCARWSALRPEERWWLFRVTVAEAGLAGDAERGWRRALRVALTDGEAAPRRPRPAATSGSTGGLFGG